MRLRAPAAASLALLVLAAAPRTPSRSVAISGLVQHPANFTLAQLREMPPHKVEAGFTTMHGQDHHVWTGVMLWDLIAKVGLRDEPGLRTTMRHVLIVSGTDGYAAAIAIGEIDPMIAGKPVIVAYRQDDPEADLPSLRLIVPGDTHGARDIHDLAGVEVR